MLDQATKMAPVLPAMFLQQKFDAGLLYTEYVSTGKDDQQETWADMYAAVALSEEQRKLVADFGREMRVIVLSGIWCGDCAQQCPLLARIGEANPDLVQVRFLDRDVHMDLASRVPINGGLRVPVVIFTAEDGEFAGFFGDRTLTRYRAMSASRLGASCPLPGAPVPTDEIRATLQDWLNEFERVQLMLRLSPRLREKHSD